MTEQNILLTFDAALLLALQASVFALARFIQGFVELLYDVEFVVQDGRMRHAFLRDVVKRPPHVHYDKPDAAGLFLVKPVIEPTGCGFHSSANWRQ